VLLLTAGVVWRWFCCCRSHRQWRRLQRLAFGFVVLLVARLCPERRRNPRRPVRALVAGSGRLAASLALPSLACSGPTLPCEISLLGVLAGILLFVWDASTSILLFPLVFLLLMIPPRHRLQSDRAAASDVCPERHETAIRLAGVPVLREQCGLKLPTTTLEVVVQRIVRSSR
jgi:hypothetical protein